VTLKTKLADHNSLKKQDSMFRYEYSGATREYKQQLGDRTLDKKN